MPVGRFQAVKPLLNRTIAALVGVVLCSGFRHIANAQGAANPPSSHHTITCCFFSSVKTLLTSTEGSRPLVKINVLNEVLGDPRG
jgi:hypothetical protein